MSHLHRLLPEMHREYHNKVTTGKMCYEVFAQQFVDSHWYIDTDSPDERNRHRMEIGLVGSLLNTNRKLAERFFQLASPTPTDVEALIRSHCQGTPQFQQESFPAVPSPTAKSYKLRCALSDDSIAMLVTSANHSFLFREPVTFQMMNDLLHDCLATPLTADNNQGIAYLFDLLAKYGFIRGRWQKVLDQSRAILKQNGQPQTASDYSSALARAKRGFGQKERIDAVMRQIIEKESGRDGASK